MCPRAKYPQDIRYPQMYPLGIFVSRCGTDEIAQTKKLDNESELAVPFLNLDTFGRSFWKDAICV